MAYRGRGIASERKDRNLRLSEQSQLFPAAPKATPLLEGCSRVVVFFGEKEGQRHKKAPQQNGRKPFSLEGSICICVCLLLSSASFAFHLAGRFYDGPLVCSMASNFRFRWGKHLRERTAGIEIEELSFLARSFPSPFAGLPVAVLGWMGLT